MVTVVSAVLASGAIIFPEKWIEREWSHRSSGATRERNTRMVPSMRSAFAPVCSRGSRALDAGRLSYAAGELSLCAPSGSHAVGFAGYAHYLQGNIAVAAKYFEKTDVQGTSLENIARDARVRAALEVPGAVRGRTEAPVGPGGLIVDIDELPALAVEPEYWRYLGQDPERLPKVERGAVFERSCEIAAALEHTPELRAAALAAFQAVSARLGLGSLRVLEVRPCSKIWPLVPSPALSLAPEIQLPLGAADVIVALDHAEGLTDSELIHFVGFARKNAKRLVLSTKTNIHSTPKRLLRTERYSSRDLLSLLPDPVTITPLNQHNIAIIVY